jgi:hypothetical protein
MDNWIHWITYIAGKQQLANGHGSTIPVNRQAMVNDDMRRVRSAAKPSAIVTSNHKLQQANRQPRTGKSR